MLMDAKKLSEVIRRKKKALLEGEPDLVDNSPVPTMNAQDVHDNEWKGRIEETINSPKKIDSDDASMDNSYDGIGLSPDEKKRMGRLRSYFDSLDMGM